VNPLTVLKKSKDWASFKKQLARLDNKGKGDCFEALTQYYLRLHPTYATALKHVWNNNKGEVPAAVHRKLNLPPQDEGIDLLAQTKEGEYWAIQCKYKTDETKSLTRKELSTFTDLSFTICKGISLGLVCTSVDRFSHKLKLYGDKLSFCSGENWRELDKEFFARVHAAIAGKAKKIEPLKPRDHQKRAIRNAQKHFVKEKNKRGKMIMPCGSGKSLTAYWIAEKLKPKRIVIAVPSLALIRQTLEVWARESLAKKRDIRWICVCSDDSVKDIAKDDIAILTQDLGVKVEGKPDKISAWLSKRSKATSVVFVTYQSGHTLAKASRKAKVKFDLGIFDEAHKTVGAAGKLFSHLLFDKNIKVTKRLFMTATERRYRGDSDDILSMDDPDAYGETFELLSFKEALECKPPILSDYQIVTMVVTTDEVKKLIRSNVLVKPKMGRSNKETEAKMLAAALQLRKAMEAHPLKHCISFHSSIARAVAFQLTQQNITKKFPKYGQLETFHVSGAMPTSARQRKLDEAVASKRSLITNARCLTEGVDVKEIDGVLFADPKGSTVDIVQAVGRALRPSKGKKRGYVVVPVVLDAKKLGKRIEQNEAYQDILMVLRALASNDERIVEYFRSVSQGKRPSGSKRKFNFVVPAGLDIDPEEFAKQVELQVWDKLAKLSWMPFEEARAWVHKLKLKTQTEWYQYTKHKIKGLPLLPSDIPKNPHTAYESKGWVGIGDWLGTGRIATQDRIYQPFEKARAFVCKLGLKNQSEWYQYSKGELKNKPKKPDDIPAMPHQTYKDKGWKTMGDWLGTGTIAPNRMVYQPFKKARALARKLKLKSRAEWQKYCKGELEDKPKKPDDIPAYPEQTYKDKGWETMGDWLGTGTIAPSLMVYQPFRKARAFARKLELKGQLEWDKYCQGKLKDKPKKRDDIPSNVARVYKDKGWKGVGDWLGYERIAPKDRAFQPFLEARAFVRKLELKSSTEWRQYCKGELKGKLPLPLDIPTNPHRTYKDEGWKNMGDWLGTGKLNPRDKPMRPFEEARAFARKLELKSSTEWYLYRQGELKDKPKKPDDIPAAPRRTYKDKGWLSWSDWLGNIAPKDITIRPFEKARAFVRKLKLKGQPEWHRYCKGELKNKPVKPNDIPSNPDKTYKEKGWEGLADFLGTAKKK
jgi:superfamily II DNA or RNA helicase